MTPKALFDLYVDSFVNGGQQNQFLKAVAHFDFSQFRLYSDTLYRCWSNWPGKLDCVKLWTNGSTSGVRHSYRFGPPAIISAIERVQKGDFVNISARGRPNQQTFIFDHHNPDFTGLLAHLNRPRALKARPFIWLYLTRQPRFLDFITKHRHLVSSIVTTDWEPFFSQSTLRQEGFWINNCMIDWQTGLNFHTCRAGYQHFLPIFLCYSGAVINWLNLGNKNIYETRDTIQIEQLRPTLCDCGDYRVGATIAGRTNPDLELAELINSHYCNLQFVTDGGTTHVYYRTIGQMTASDRTLFGDRFGDVVYHEDSMAICGIGKWPAFWDTSLGPVQPHHCKI